MSIVHNFLFIFHISGFSMMILKAVFIDKMSNDNVIYLFHFDS